MKCIYNLAWVSIRIDNRPSFILLAFAVFDEIAMNIWPAFEKLLHVCVIIPLSNADLLVESLFYTNEELNGSFALITISMASN